jgi:hypothetical protein
LKSGTIQNKGGRQMKKRIVAGLFLIAILTMTISLTGCDKTTGGGQFTADSLSVGPTGSLQGNFCTFGFNAQPVNQPYPGGEGAILAKGNFQFVDHKSKTNVHGDFQVTLEGSNNNGSTDFAGLCTVNKEGPFVFGAVFTPGQQDKVLIEVFKVSSFADVDLGNPWYTYSGTLNHGSIVVHSK